MSLPKTQFDLALLKSTPHVVDVTAIKEHAQKYAHTDFVTAVDKAIDEGKAAYRGDFFIEVRMIDQRHLRSTMDHFIVRQTCPLPDFNTIVYRWHREDDKIEYLWMLPSKYKALALLSDVLTPDTTNKRAKAFVVRFMNKELHALSDSINEELEARVVG